MQIKQEMKDERNKGVRNRFERKPKPKKPGAIAANTGWKSKIQVIEPDAEQIAQLPDYANVLWSFPDMVQEDDDMLFART